MGVEKKKGKKKKKKKKKEKKNKWEKGQAPALAGACRLIFFNFSDIHHMCANKLQHVACHMSHVTCQKDGWKSERKKKEKKKKLKKKIKK